MMNTNLLELILELKGCPIHYWVGGPEGKPLVVFTHGACVDHRSFDPIIPVVAQEYRVLTWDVRGHGKSQPAGERFTVPLAVEDLLELVEQQGYQKAVFVGHSNGTYIAQELAFCCPEKVQALVIADGTCITWNHTALDQWMINVGVAMMEWFPYETLKKASLPNISAKKEIQDYTYDAYSMLSKKDFIGIMKGISSCLHYEPDYHITQPLLLVHGDQDKMGDIRKIAPKWAMHEPNCQYEVIPNAKHFAILDNPEYFNKLLMEFLEKWVTM